MEEIERKMKSNDNVAKDSFFQKKKVLHLDFGNATVEVTPVLSFIFFIFPYFLSFSPSSSPPPSPPSSLIFETGFLCVTALAFLKLTL